MNYSREIRVQYLQPKCLLLAQIFYFSYRNSWMVAILSTYLDLTSKKQIKIPAQIKRENSVC